MQISENIVIENVFLMLVIWLFNCIRGYKDFSEQLTFIFSLSYFHVKWWDKVLLGCVNKITCKKLEQYFKIWTDDQSSMSSSKTMIIELWIK